MGLLQPGSSAMQTGFFVSTIGITAIGFGIYALRCARRGLAASTLAARAGITFGAIGSGLTVYALAAFLLLPQGIMLPRIPSFGASTHPGLIAGGFAFPQPTAATIAPTQPRTATPAPASARLAPFTSVRDEQLALAQGVGSLSVPLRSAIAAQHSCPVSLDQITRTQVGAWITRLPGGARFDYSPLPDGSACTISLTGGQFHQKAIYSSATGVIGFGSD